MTSNDPDTVRAFLAVEFDPTIHTALVRLKSEFARTRASVRWVRDAGLHSTIKFLGQTTPEQLAAIRDALSPVLAGVPSFGVRVAGLGAFPSLRRPRVVWVGLQSTQLVPLARRVEDLIAPVGFPAERRRFQPHITLGRVRGMRGWEPLEEALKAHWTDDFGASDITEVVAYRSDLRPDGAVYTKQWTIPLQPSRRREADGRRPDISG